MSVCLAAMGQPLGTPALTAYLAVSAVLFSLGLVGFMVRRNMIVMFLAAEMMLQGVSLTATAFGRYHQDWGGQMLVIFIIAVAAAEAGLALAQLINRKAPVTALTAKVFAPPLPEVTYLLINSSDPGPITNLVLSANLICTSPVEGFG